MATHVYAHERMHAHIHTHTQTQDVHHTYTHMHASIHIQAHSDLHVLSRMVAGCRRDFVLTKPFNIIHIYMDEVGQMMVSSSNIPSPNHLCRYMFLPESQPYAA